jgi:DNA-binding MarR family transcriptional regulator
VLVTAGRGEVDLLGAVRRTVPAFLDLRNVFATIAIVTERVDPPSNPASKPHADTLETSRLLVELVHAVYATRAAEAETAAGVGGQDGSSTDGGVGTGSLHGSARAHSAPSAGGVPVRREAPSTHAIRAAFHVYQHGQRTIGQLADGLGISYGWASRVVTELEAGGLVERRVDPSDRRVVNVLLTPEALAMVERTYRWRAEAIQRALDGLSPEQRAGVRAFLRRATEELARAGHERPG